MPIRKIKSDTIYVFIDSQNLNFGTTKDIFDTNGKTKYKGWKLDMKKFYRYLKDKFRISKAFLFIGYIEANNGMYERFKSYGFEIIFKPTVKDKSGKPKGNVDAEIVLHAARLKYDEFDSAIFVSGDGDFYCLYEFLVEQNKLKALIIPNKYSESSLLKTLEIYKHYLYREKVKLEYKNKENKGEASLIIT